VFGMPLYCSIAVAALLSVVNGASMEGLADMKYQFGDCVA
jgi:hypothetical protein